MLYHAKNGNVKIGNTDMDYICFGNGTKPLVLIPGLGDGLRTVKGTAFIFALLYQQYAKDYRVFVFSRKNKLDTGYSCRDMARDQITALNALGIVKADVMGISQGGMIAQWIAIDYPDTVNRLVLAVTVSRQNETMQKVIKNWIQLARAGDYQGIMMDIAEKSYSSHYLKRYRPFIKLFCKIGKPKDFNRFLIQANACITHDSYDVLDRIICPVLVIGGGRDQTVGVEASREIAGKILNSTLLIYPDLGHAAYEEAKDFHMQVLDFLHKGFRP